MVSKIGVAGASLFFLAAAFCSGRAAAVEVVWSHRTAAGQMAGSPAMGDVDGDGVDELATADTAGVVSLFRGNGEVVWQRRVPSPVTIAPSLADVYTDAVEGAQSPLELLVVNGLGTVYCLDAGTGRLIWEYVLPHGVDWGNTALSVCDIEQDGALEIITGDMEGGVVCLTGDGEARWQYAGAHGHTLCPASADLDGDGLLETLIAGNKTALVCLSPEGSVLWELGEGKAGASPVVWDLDADSRPEIVAGMGSELVVVNGDGTLRWAHAMQREIDSAISVADADQDGTPEIYAVDLSGTLACVHPDGTLRWSGSVGQRARRSPSIGDVDGDGAAEILVAGYSWAIHVFTPDGVLQEQVTLPGPSNATATIMRVGGGSPETWRTGVVCPTEEGTLQALVWPAVSAEPRILWAGYRMNAARTASQPLDPIARTVQVAAIEIEIEETKRPVYRVRITNPERRGVTIHASVSLDGVPVEDGKLQSSKTNIHYRLPYRLNPGQSGRLVFTCTVDDGGRTVARRTHVAYVNPFSAEIDTAEAQLVEVESTLPQLADQGRMKAELVYLRAELQAHRTAASNRRAMTVREHGALKDDLSTTLDAVSQLQALVQAAADTREAAEGSLLLCAANPWAPFGGIDETIEGRTPPPNLTVDAFGGETESAALNIFNFGDTARTLRMELEPIRQQGSDATDNAGSVNADTVIALHEAVEVPTLLLEDSSFDAIPRLNQARTITVPPWSGRQIWLNVDTASLSAGSWQGAIQLRTLEAASVDLTANLDITVWDSALPAEQPLRLCHWGYVEGSFLKEYPDEALEDQVSHGTNVFVSLHPPKARFDERGRIVGPIDFTEHDAYVRRHAPHGLILFCGYQGGLEGPGGPEGAAYGKAFVPYLHAWVRHLAKLGVGYDGFALYPIDEIGLHPDLAPRYLQLARLARAADPKVQMYADVTVGLKEEEWNELVPYIDIWCPNTAGFLLDRNQDKLAFMKATGKTVWSYECYGVAKHQSPLGYYRAQSWRAWHHDLTGIGFWTYCTTHLDPWASPRNSNEYTMVYPGTGVVSSKRWEAVRDGIEDFSMLDRLRGAWNSAGGAARHPDVAPDVDRLLGAEASVISEYCNFEEWDVKPGPEGLASRRVLEDERWAAYRAARAAIARLLAPLEDGR